MCCMVYLQTPASIFIVFCFVWCNDLDYCLLVFGLELQLAVCLALGETWSDWDWPQVRDIPPPPRSERGRFGSPAITLIRLALLFSVWRWRAHGLSRFSWAWLPGSSMARKCTSASRVNSAFVCPGGKMGEGPSLYLSFFFKEFIIWSV